FVAVQVNVFDWPTPMSWFACWYGISVPWLSNECQVEPLLTNLRMTFWPTCRWMVGAGTLPLNVQALTCTPGAISIVLFSTLIVSRTTFPFRSGGTSADLIGASFVAAAPCGTCWR